MKSTTLHHRVFLLLLCIVTAGFLVILWPFWGAVFWGVVLAVLFAPLHQRLLARMPQRRNLAALATLAICLVIVILPLVLIGASLVREATLIYENLNTGELNFGAYYQQIMSALPSWATRTLDSVGLTSVAEIQERLSSIAVQASKVAASQAVGIGQNTMGFIVGFGVMLYLLFFLLRDGAQLASRIRYAFPLEPAHKTALASKFTTVVRATIKGNMVVAMAQGALGGLIFWILDIQGPVLWGVVMAFLSLLPAVGAALIWGPVAIYFLATGDIVKGSVLAAYGVLVIGLVDNVLRPLLVGKDTKMPDYIVLISTLGGMALFGLTGFVVGPLIAALFIAIWDLFGQDHHAGADVSTTVLPPKQ
ncbi:AI-2E family transporter [Comamonas endophytica]|uniref:AI-2E family transporter n=1 Tax=Comamonas endophytica TaxID=2949090 RepID=A0ABY6GAF8_9BURK|nr:MULTISPECIES: AI-2E family transporter [unclassified Acidovorax]MCD2511760.1 AI-2E family transporter [Acidovorax sp. D4N7]UYG51484.1 AI-2E family transporter [Acidovorax sp. 5MLIR]